MISDESLRYDGFHAEPASNPRISISMARQWANYALKKEAGNQVLSLLKGDSVNINCSITLHAGFQHKKGAVVLSFADQQRRVNWSEYEKVSVMVGYFAYSNSQILAISMKFSSSTFVQIGALSMTIYGNESNNLTVIKCSIEQRSSALAKHLNLRTEEIMLVKGEFRMEVKCVIFEMQSLEVINKDHAFLLIMHGILYELISYLVHDYPKDALKLETSGDIEEGQYPGPGHLVTINCSHTPLNKPNDMECSKYHLFQTFADGRSMVVPRWLIKKEQLIVKVICLIFACYDA